MKTRSKILLLAIITFGIASCSSEEINESTDNKILEMENNEMSKEEATELVKPFYDFLGGEGSPEGFKPVYHEDWKSFYDNTESRDMEETIGFVSGPLAEMVPDLKWKIIAVYVTSDDQIIVRGEATGTPVGDNFMGSPIEGGKEFKFMSIDIHELKDGKIYQTFHVEDWLNAIEQVAIK